MEEEEKDKLEIGRSGWISCTYGQRKDFKRRSEVKLKREKTSFLAADEAADGSSCRSQSR